MIYTRINSKFNHNSLKHVFINTARFYVCEGFHLAHATDGELELCPGITLASFTHLKEEEARKLPGKHRIGKRDMRVEDGRIFVLICC
jgi:hypothetical protein